MSHQHPAAAVGCSAYECMVFEMIMDGLDTFEGIDPVAVKSLINKGLLSEEQDNIMPPAIVWSQWEDYQKDKDNKFDVELFGTLIGSAETWDQADATSVSYRNFYPVAEYADSFGNPMEGLDILVDPFKGYISITDASGLPIKEVHLVFKPV